MEAQIWGRNKKREKETSRDKAGLAGGVGAGEPLGSKSGEILAGETHTHTHKKRVITLLHKKE